MQLAPKQRPKLHRVDGIIILHVNRETLIKFLHRKNHKV